MANTLFLRLEGPLQAWGERARWGVRDSAPEPTKSGVVGLLGCALGVRDDASLRNLSQRLRMGVRCDRAGVRLIDYHTIIGGATRSEGGSNRQIAAELSWRHYLADASFLVALQTADATLIDQLAQAVQDPIWPFYLGRRACPPSRPPFAGVGDFASLEEALTRVHPLTEPVRSVIECGPVEGALRRDDVLSRERRTFGPRYTRDVWLQPVAGSKEEPCTSPA